MVKTLFFLVALAGWTLVCPAARAQSAPAPAPPADAPTDPPSPEAASPEVAPPNPASAALATPPAAPARPAPVSDSAVAPKATSPWPYQEPLFALYAAPQNAVRLRTGFSNHPEVNSLGLVLEGSYTFSRFTVTARLPFGVAMSDRMDTAMTFGDLEIGARFLVSAEKETQKHLAVGLNLLAPISRIGEEGNVAAIQSGAKTDPSNMGKRYLLAQRPFLDMGLLPRLDVGFVPYVAFGQNIDRVSLQTDIGCLILDMDNVRRSVYGIDRRWGFILFYDLAAPVAITRTLSIVGEFNALIALDGLIGTGFAFTIGPRYVRGPLSVGAGLQIPLGVDNERPEDDKMLGRYDATIVARHQFSGILDLSYSF